MTRRVEGVYPTVDDALRAVDRLTDEGYSRDNIILVANEDVRNTFTANLNIEGMDEARLTKTEEDKSLWDSIKDLFTSDDFYDDPNYDVDNNPLFAHREKIKSGEIAVVVSDKPTNHNTDTIAPDVDDPYTMDPDIMESDVVDPSVEPRDAGRPSPSDGVVADDEITPDIDDPHTMDPDVMDSKPAWKETDKLNTESPVVEYIDPVGEDIFDPGTDRTDIINPDPYDIGPTEPETTESDVFNPETDDVDIIDPEERKDR